MGLVQKKDEKDYIDGIEVIGRGDGPDPDMAPEIDCEIVPGQTAEDISGTTAARNEGMETQADLELLGSMAEDAAEEAADDGEADAIDHDAADADADLDADVDVDAAADTEDAAESTEGSDAEADGDDAVAADIDAAGDKVASEGSEPEAAPTFESDGAATGKRRNGLFVAGMLIIVVAVGIIGYTLGAGTFGTHKGTGAASITDEQLDSVVASWTFDGASHNITAREAIESQYSLSASKQDDDTYAVPSAETVLSYVRNQILVADAKKQGMDVSDDELSAYATQNMGTDDFAAIAEQFSVSEDQAKDILRDQSLIQKLYQEKVGTVTQMPEQPTAPADDAAAATPTQEYADYIIALAGDEWDADAGDWAATDGPVALALADQDFSPEGATYEQAQMAFAAVYRASYEEAQQSQQQWTDYANSLFASAQVELYGIFA